VREVVVDLPPHPIDLLHDPRADVVVTVRLGAFGLLREHGKRRFQAVREVARLGDRARHDALAVGEQRIQIVDERLHLRRIRPAQLAVHAFAHVGETVAHAIERRQRPAHQRQARGHAADSNHRRQGGCGCE
jgi:hypothetical protein